MQILRELLLYLPGVEKRKVTEDFGCDGRWERKPWNVPEKEIVDARSIALIYEYFTAYLGRFVAQGVKSSSASLLPMDNREQSDTQPCTAKLPFPWTTSERAACKKGKKRSAQRRLLA